MGKKIAAEVHHLELSAAGCSYNVVWCRVVHTYLRVCIGLSAAAIAVTVVVAFLAAEAVIMAALHLVLLQRVAVLHNLHLFAVAVVAMLVYRQDSTVSQI